jgi:beta-lactamase superfamily II metal-dependent hydrolase
VPFEIDFFPAGESKRSGDVIAFRFGGLTGPADQTVVVVDGGFSDVGRTIVDHVTNVYGTTYVDLVISTHPDGDHIAGLESVVRDLGVGALWMHQPWLHTYETHGLYKDQRVTPESVRKKLQKSLEEAQILEKLATERRIPITEPFTGVAAFDSIYVLGPSLPYYQSLLPQFRSTPKVELTDSLAKALTATLTSDPARMLKRLQESLWEESLDDGGQTSPENNTSVILHLFIDGQRMILTGDAGAPALNQAADVLEAYGFAPESLRFMQIPHHGSKENVGPQILDRLIGAIGTRGTDTWRAYASVAPEGAPLHPAKKVTNAFRRRGAAVSVTAGKGINFFSGVPMRPNWSAVPVLPFYSEVDE